jgi:hypothetical protein
MTPDTVGYPSRHFIFNGWARSLRARSVPGPEIHGWPAARHGRSRKARSSDCHRGVAVVGRAVSSRPSPSSSSLSQRCRAQYAHNPMIEFYAQQLYIHTLAAGARPGRSYGASAAGARTDRVRSRLSDRLSQSRPRDSELSDRRCQTVGVYSVSPSARCPFRCAPGWLAACRLQPVPAHAWCILQVQLAGLPWAWPWPRARLGAWGVRTWRCAHSDLDVGAVNIMAPNAWPFRPS